MEISLGKKQNSWSYLEGVAGFLKMKRKEIDNMVSENKEISVGLEEVNLPYENFANIRSFDEIMASDEVLNTLKSAPNQLGLINRGIMKVKQFTGSGNGITQITNHFASIIGNQTADNFVKNSMNTLLQNGFHAGTKAIVNGLKGAGLKASMTGVGAAVGAVSGPVGWVIAGATFLKKTFGKLAEKLGLGTKKFIEENFGKVGGAIVKGLSAAVVLPTALIGSMGIAIASPVIIGVILGLFGIQILQVNGNISSLVPRIESDEIEDGNEVGKPPTHGEITILEDGRIGDCGVGMGADFGRNGNKPMAPGSMSDDELSSFNNQLSETVGDQLGTRCGVVYAAHFLAYDYKYWVPYWFGGRFEQKGINPKWGAQLPPTEDNKNRKGNGLDCGHFRTWAWINGGFPGGTPGNSNVIPFGDCEKIKSEIEPGDGLFMYKLNEEGYTHSAIVLAYDNNNIKFAHSGGGSGVSTGLIDICTGKLDGGNMTFNVLQKKIYNDSNL